MAKKILITEEIAQPGIDFLKDRGYEVECKLDLSQEELRSEVSSYDALIVRSATAVTEEVIEAGKNLKIIGRAGVGVDNIDVDAATERGVIVCNAPTSNIISAAEHTMALLLASARKIAQADYAMKQGIWDRTSLTGVELYKKTLAIFGLGRVGGLVAKRAKAFGMNLIGYDPYCSSERAESLDVKLYSSIEEVLPLADFITVHLPKTEETIGMFGPEEYAIMKDGVILVNAARGGIYNIKSLSDFIAAGKIAACGIDVWDEIPCTDSPLHCFDEATLTPHLGAATKEAQLRAAVQIAEFVASGLEGSIVPTAINMAPVPPEVLDLVGPYVPASQLLGSMLSQISKGAIPQTLRVTAAGTLAGSDTEILCAAALDGFLSYQKKSKVTPVNARSVAQRHGIKMESLSVPDAQEYASAITLYADGLEVACTLSGVMQKPRIISLLGYSCDITPAKHVLIFEYEDRPGRVGVIGSILGEANINIETMQISKKEKSDKAIVFMNVDGDVNDEVLDQISQKIDFDNMWYLKF